MLNYQSVFTETIFTTLLFLCNSVKVAQLVKDKKGKTCIHKLKRRWQWTKISEANKLECRRAALVCVEGTRAAFCAVPQESVSQIPQQDVAVHCCSLPSCCSVLFDHEFLWNRKLLASKNHYQSWQMPTKNSFPYAQRFTFLAVSMLLAISYPLTIPRDFVRSPACEIIIGLVFLKANCFSGYLLLKVYGWPGCMFCKGF